MRRGLAKMPFVYILKSSSGKYYVGSTLELRKRLRDHRSGQTYSTNRMGELNLIFSQEYSSLSDARSVERKLKKLKRRDYIENIINEGKIKLRP